MANEHIGARQEIGFKIESTRGTAISPSTGDWIPHTGISFIPVVEKVEDVSGMGHIAGRRSADVAKEYSKGSVSMKLYDGFLTTLNTLIFGASGTTVGSATTYTLENTNVHKSCTVGTADPVSGDQTYAMAMLNTCSIAVATDDYVNLTMDFVAGKETAATLTPAYSSTSIQYTPEDVTLAYADDYAGLSSPTALAVKNVNLNIEKGVDIDWVLGDTEPADIYNQRFNITGDVTVTYDATTMKGLALAGTSKAVIITINNLAYKWEIKLPAVQFEDWNRSSDLDSFVTQTFGIKAQYSDTTNGFVQAVVTDL